MRRTEISANYSAVAAVERVLPGDRQSKVGPEAELVQGALSAGFPLRLGGRTVGLAEARLPTGYPDLLIAALSSRTPKIPPERRALGLDHIRLLHRVFHAGSLLERDLKPCVVGGRRRTHRLVSDLVEAELLTRRAGRLRQRSLRASFFLTRLVAVEAKVSNWKKALEQAIANTWFASESYVLLPWRKELESVAATAARHGIGVMAYDGKRVHIAQKSMRWSLPSSFGSWIVNERILRELSGERASDRHQSCQGSIQ